MIIGTTIRAEHQEPHLDSNRPEMATAAQSLSIQYQAMLTRLYVEALVVDEDLADQVCASGIEATVTGRQGKVVGG